MPQNKKRRLESKNPSDSSDSDEQLGCDDEMFFDDCCQEDPFIEDGDCYVPSFVECGQDDAFFGTPKDPPQKNEQQKQKAPKETPIFKKWVNSLGWRLNPPAMDSLLETSFGEIKEKIAECVAKGEDPYGLWLAYQEIEEYIGFQNPAEVSLVSKYFHTLTFEVPCLEMAKVSYAQSGRIELPCAMGPRATVRFAGSGCEMAIRRLGNVSTISATVTESIASCIWGALSGSFVRDTDNFTDGVAKHLEALANFRKMEKMAGQDDVLVFLAHIQRVYDHTHARPRPQYEYAYLWKTAFSDLEWKCEQLFNSVRSEYCEEFSQLPFFKKAETTDSKTEVRCDCGVAAKLRKSQTKKNPGRTFYGCPFYGTETKACKFFQWT